jgi:hypothetical protein
MDRTCRSHGRERECMQGLGGKTRMKETTRNTWT